MVARSARVLVPSTLLLLAALLAGCAGAPAASPTAEASQALPTPVIQASAPTPRPPTATPTPRPPKPTPTPSPTPTDAAALLKQIQGKKQEVKSARGLMEIKVEGRENGRPRAVTMTIEFASAEPDAWMKMSGEGIPEAFEMEFIAKGDTAYLRMQDEWMAFPNTGEGLSGSEMEMVDVDELESFLADASSVKSVGRRNVKGTECDVISFTLSPEKIRELAALPGNASARRALDEEINLDKFRGEVAIGTADKLVRQMVFEMSGSEKGQAEKFTMTFDVVMWDLNSPDIVIKAPEGVKPAGFPTPTRRK